MQSLCLPKLSIIMPVLNGVKTFEKALRSVLDQHYDNLELIIIDAGSTDGTIDLIKRYESYFTYWHSRPDGGPIVGANQGIKRATGDLIALLMADDWYEPATLKKIGYASLQYKDADIISCGGRIVEYDATNNCYRPKWVYATAKKMELTFKNICFDVVSAICCRFIRQSLFQRIGPFIALDSRGKPLLSNDKEFLLRAMIYQVKNVYVNHVGHNYLAHPGSSTFGNQKINILKLCYEHMEIIESHLETYQHILSTKQKFGLIYWYHDQSTRLILYKLLDLNFRMAFLTTKKSLKKYNIFWVFGFVETTCRIILKRVFRLLKGSMMRGKNEKTYILSDKL